MGATSASAMKKLLRLKRYVRSGNALESVGLRDVAKHKDKSQGTATSIYCTSTVIVATFHSVQFVRPVKLKPAAATTKGFHLGRGLTWSIC